MKRFLLWTLAGILVLAGAGYAAFTLSPWPAALVIRHLFDREAEAKLAAMRKHVPAGIAERLDERYDPADPDARIDIYTPAGGDGPLPAVVWVHGGAWISGHKGHVGNYLRILAARGYVTVAVGYSIAPGATYPTPVRQVNAALGHLARHATRLRIDPARMFLAGDSAGSQISGQLANIVTSPDHARALGLTPAIAPAQLRGIILHCGAFDAEQVDYDGAFGGFLRTVLWSYFGRKDFLNDPRLRDLSVIRNLTPGFPPIFISVGNGDPLEPQSRLLAKTAADLGVPVDALFFPKDHKPPLPHEYQFDFSFAASAEALERSAAFLSARAK